MVAGMTPCTVHPSFVIATMNGGYQIELAGGGYFDPRMMETAVREIVAKTNPGAGICINAIYINPRLFNWQMDLVKSLRANGVGVEGVTIGAGVPSMEVATDLFLPIQPSILTLESPVSKNWG
jgi:fatty acid synthase subunit beta